MPVTEVPCKACAQSGKECISIECKLCKYRFHPEIANNRTINFNTCFACQVRSTNVDLQFESQFDQFSSQDLSHQTQKLNVSPKEMKTFSQNSKPDSKGNSNLFNGDTLTSHGDDPEPTLSQPKTRSYPPSPRIQYYRMTKTEPLPIFDGSEPEIWITFELIYLHLKACGFQRDELIAEVSAAVKGTARRFIQDLFLVREEPDLMISTLKRFYGDSKQVLYKLAKSIQTSIAPRDAPKSKLLDFALRLKSLVTTAKAFNEPSYLKQPFLCDEIVEMLRGKHRDWWHVEKRTNPNADLETLSQYLLDRSTDPSAISDSPRDEYELPPTLPPLVDASTRLHRKSNQLYGEAIVSDSMKQCFKCHQPHNLLQCPAFHSMTGQERFT